MNGKSDKRKIDDKQPAPAAAPGGGLPAPAAANSGVPDYLEDMSAGDSGRGVSTEASDNIVPMVYILQKGSPQVNEQDPQYIPGAKAGSIWLRNSAVELVAGAEGILFQPCHFDKAWPEWVPRDRGGGFVARHGNRAATARDAVRFKSMGLASPPEVGEDVPDVEDAAYRIDPKNKMKSWFRPNGNELKLTRNHAGHVVLSDRDVLPYVIPLTGSGHGVSRNWMFAMMSKRRKDGRILPAWSCLYRLTTRWRKNQAGDWWQFDVADAGYVDVAGYKRGKELCDAFESGAKVAEDEVVESGAGADAGAPPGGGAGEDLPY